MTMCATGASCGRSLLPGAQRRHCSNCRQVMANWAKRTVREIKEHSDRLQRGVYRVEHMDERKMDIQEALSQKRRDRRVYKTSVKATNGRARP